MRNCKIVPTEKCIQCQMCEPYIELDEEKAKRFIEVLDKLEKDEEHNNNNNKIKL